MNKLNLIKKLIKFNNLNEKNSNLIELTNLSKLQLKWFKDSIDLNSTNTNLNLKELKLNEMVNEFINLNKPLAYIIGDQPFHPLPIPLLVRPPTLIPRPETEHWTNQLASILLPTFNSTSTTSINTPQNSSFKILDIGTGSGCIPLSLYWNLKQVVKKLEIIGVDKDPFALSLARENVERCLKTLEKGKWKEEDGSAERDALEGGVKIVEGDLWDSNFVNSMRKEIRGNKFDLIVSNPPYITRKDYEGLDSNVRDWEDRNALVGDRITFQGEEAEELNDDGLIFYTRITNILKELIYDSTSLVSRRPVIVLEVGKGQSEQVSNMILRLGLKSEIWKDPWNIDRTVVGYLN